MSAEVISEIVAGVVAGADGLVLQSESNAIWLVLTGALVFLMHCGFAMLEAGSVQKASVKNIMFKNMGTVTVGGLWYWLLGFGFAYGSCVDDTNGFIGTSNFAYDPRGQCGDVSAFYFFEFTFAATGATIVSGAVAERITLGAYFTVAAFITGFVFPVISHWIWSSSGFMSAFASGAGELVDGSIGLIDFAGSGVVHLTGGAAALVGAMIIGPRAGRFIDGVPVALPPASYTLQTLGTFILWFGWYGFNCGSTLVMDGTNIAKAAVTTTLAPSGAAVTAVLYSKLVRGRYDLPTVLNSILAGLVGITAGCTAVFDWSAIVIGAIASLVYIGAANLVEKLGIDDPIGAAPVHGAAGIWGVVAVGIFADKDAISDSYGVDPADFDQGAQFGMQVVGPILIALWSGVLCGILFLSLKFLGVLRISPEIEEKGLDESEHGGAQILHF